MKSSLVIFCSLLLVACSNREKRPAPVKAMDTSKPVTHASMPARMPDRKTNMPSFTELDRHLARFKRPSQLLYAGSDTNGTLVGARGTRIAVVPRDLEYPDGSPISGRVAVELIELHTQTDLLRHGVTTTSNGRLLESGGSYYINLTADGKRVRLKQGRQLAVTFPKKTPKDMMLYYGAKDRAGDINWLAANMPFTSGLGVDSVIVRMEIPIYKDTMLEKLPTRPTRYERRQGSEKYMAYAPIEVYVSNGQYSFMGRVRDTNKWYYDQKKAGNDVLADEFYGAMRLSGWGWINLDKPVTVETQVLASAVSGVKAATIEVFIVYKDINSIERRRIIVDGSGEVLIAGLAKNHMAKIVALTWKDRAAYAYTQTISTSDVSSLKLKMKKVTDQELDVMLAM